MKRALLFLLIFCPLLCQAKRDELKKRVLVVYNSEAEGSETLARYYAQKRSIPSEFVFALKCSTQEEISRDNYEKTVRNPIHDYLISQGWLKHDSAETPNSDGSGSIHLALKNNIWAIVLMRGVPVKISLDSSRLGRDANPTSVFSTNAAAIDSELATLPMEGSPLSGYVVNPYFATSGFCREFDEFDAKHMILVTRLDGPTVKDVQRMIDDSLDAEENRLSGLVCIDTRGLGAKESYGEGDQWLRQARDYFQEEGWPIELDESPNVFADNLPWSQVAIYLGWYADNPSGPMFHAPRRFAPGAIAYHIHSFSADTLRTAKQHWVGPLINAGAAACLGSVYEPYLDFMPHPDLFSHYLLEGYTFAEAAYASQASLSWMITVIGDPLYTPFAENLSATLTEARQGAHSNRDWVELQHMRREIFHHHFNGGAKELEEALVRPGCSDVLWEGLGDFLVQPDFNAPKIQTITAYRHAYEQAQRPVDHIRIGLKLAHLYETNSQPSEKTQLLKELNSRWPLEASFYHVPGALTTFVPFLSPTARPHGNH